jgi:hypothetical protein
MKSKRYLKDRILSPSNRGAIPVLSICIEIVVIKRKGNFEVYFRMEYLSQLIMNNISLCTFDFVGCGNAQGEYVTLGYR